MWKLPRIDKSKIYSFIGQTSPLTRTTLYNKNGKNLRDIGNIPSLYLFIFCERKSSKKGSCLSSRVGEYETVFCSTLDESKLCFVRGWTKRNCLTSKSGRKDIVFCPTLDKSNFLTGSCLLLFNKSISKSP